MAATEQQGAPPWQRPSSRGPPHGSARAVGCSLMAATEQQDAP
jgi:hypothetical protein